MGRITAISTEDADEDGNGDNPTSITDTESEAAPRHERAPDWGTGDPSPPAGGCTIIGTEGDDVIPATQSPGNDVICGLGGDDQINAGAGSDTVRAGPGRDTITGGAGNDELRGGLGRDDMTDLAGRDRLFGGGAQDDLDSEDGQGGDRLDGRAGNDACRADKGDVKKGC